MADDIRDVQRTESVSKFLDSHVVRVNPFGDNRAADRAYRRAERIAAAIHLLTSHVEESEPIRASLRSRAIQLLAAILDARDEMRASHSHAFKNALSEVRGLISLARLLALSGFASTQNAQAIIEALDELGTFLQVSQRTSFSESVAISREELVDVGVLSTSRPMTVSKKDNTDVEYVREESEAKSDVSEAKSAHMNNGRLSVRTQSVLEILKSGGTMAIKDICSNLPEYSEKMIQRELLALVADGKVMKSGLKRWSRYSIAGA